VHKPTVSKGTPTQHMLQIVVVNTAGYHCSSLDIATDRLHNDTYNNVDDAPGVQ
jgi:hypothetical protein